MDLNPHCCMVIDYNVYFLNQHNYKYITILNLCLFLLLIQRYCIHHKLIVSIYSEIYCKRNWVLTLKILHVTSKHGVFGLFGKSIIKMMASSTIETTCWCKIHQL